MSFQELNISEWKQFENLEIEFHPRLTILTGANGSGKTTILNLLSRHFGWGLQELSTPTKDKKTGKFRFIVEFLHNIAQENQTHFIGELRYANGDIAKLSIPNSDQAQYQINIQNQQGVSGFYIPSHRAVFYYSPVSQLSTKKRKKDEAFNLVSSVYKNFASGSRKKPSNYYIKETLLTWAIYGYGNEVIEKDSEQMEYYVGFQDILTKVLPQNIGFKRLVIRNSEIVLETQSGEFMLDAVSGGISAIIDLAWQVYMFQTKEESAYTVLIDEIENHLHATMQRQVLSDFLNAFPKARFIVSTHSPLIVGSVKDSNVYALRYNSVSRVYSDFLDLKHQAKTATEILRDVLGVPFTMPIWVEEQLNHVVDKYSSSAINENTFTALRGEMSELGLEHLVPESIGRLLEKNND